VNAKRILLLTCVISGLVFPGLARAAANLTIQPITWNVIGLDSNNVNAGPEFFPVGVRVCNNGDAAAANVTSAFIWDNPTDTSYINLADDSLSTYSGSRAVASLAASACTDFYYNVRITRNSNSYWKARRYHITASANAPVATVSTPVPRELYVEKILSQSRNAVLDFLFKGVAEPVGSFVSVPPGGTMNMLVGNTYSVRLIADTATNGYNQIEAYINFPSNYFTITAVSTTYTADTSPYVSNPVDLMYGDSCLWDNEPTSPTYRMCLGVDGKNGGDLVVDYTVKVIAAPAVGVFTALNTLIYDMSGSSYHYNSDYSTSYRVPKVDPPTADIKKTFNPRAIEPGQNSLMTVKLYNPMAEALTDVNFLDYFPTNMTIANTTTSTTGCGTPTLYAPYNATSFSAGATSIAFASATIQPKSTCVITMYVTAPVKVGAYDNITEHLFINSTIDTTKHGQDQLTVEATNLFCTTGVVLAQWNVPTGAPVPPDIATPVAGSPTTKAGDVATAVAMTTDTGSKIDAAEMGTAVSWMTTGWPKLVGRDVASYYQYSVDTSKYKDIAFNFSIGMKNNGPTSWDLYYTPNGGSELPGPSNPYTIATPGALQAHTAAIGSSYLAGGTTVFRVYASGASNQGKDAEGHMDAISVTGTRCIPAPTLAKIFVADPIRQVQASCTPTTSVLRFTISNTATGNQALSGLAFTDILPEGLDVAAQTPTSNCGGTATVTPATRTIALTGGTIAADATCTIEVTVTGTKAGYYENFTSFLSTTQTGTTKSSGYDDITVIAPPVIVKGFTPSQILTGGTSTLKFQISNPNAVSSLGSIAFTDLLPAGVTATNGTTGSLCGSGTLVVSTDSGTGRSLLTFSGGSLNAAASCTFSLTVTGSPAGTYNNVTSTVTTANSCEGNTAQAQIRVTDPALLLGLNKLISTDNTNWYKAVSFHVPGALAPTTGDIPGNVYYKFIISNEGEGTLNVISVTDPLVAPGDPLPSPCTLPTTLAVGASAECATSSIPVTAIPSPNPLINTATATATGVPAVTSKAMYGTESLSLVKTGQADFCTAGEAVAYSYLVTNTGVYTLPGGPGVTVSDDKEIPVTCPVLTTVGDNDADLDPGESITCTASYTVLAGDMTAGFVTNTAYAAVAGVESPNDSVTVSKSTDDFLITKTADSLVYSGGAWTVTYTIGVKKNAGPRNGNGFTIQDTIPSQLNTPVTITSCPSGHTCSAPAGVLTWSATGLNMVVNDTFSMSFSATLNDATGGFTNTADMTASTPRDCSYPSASAPINPTASSLTDFQVTPDARGGAEVAWTTAAEAGTVGFHLYRWDDADNRFLPVTNGLLPGFMDTFEGGVHRFIDQSAPAGAPLSYLLVEQETSGRRIPYGPFSFAPGADGAAADPQQFLNLSPGAWGSIPAAPVDDGNEDLTQIYASERQPNDPLRTARIEKAVEAEVSASAGFAAAGTSLAAEGLALNAAAASGAGSPAVKITTRGEGLFFLSAADVAPLLGLGVDQAVAKIGARRLALKSNGQNVAWLPAADNSGLWFYARNLRTTFSDDNVFWLTVGAGATMASIGAAPPALPVSPNQSFSGTVHAEQDLTAAQGTPDPDRALWCWDYLISGVPSFERRSFAVTADFAVPGANAALTLHLLVTGKTVNHRVAVSLNGTPIGERNWTGAGFKDVTLQFPSALLMPGANSVEVSTAANPGDMYVVIYVDSLDISYPRSYRTSTDLLAVRGNGNQLIGVGGFSNADIVVLDVTNPLRPKVRQGSVTAEEGGTFQTAFMPSSATTPYVVTTFAGDRTPRLTAARIPSRILGRTMRADWVAVTTPALLESTRQLAARRQAQGLETQVVLLDEIMDAFSQGAFDPKSIKKFITHATTKWAKRPRFVVLVGDGSQDYRNVLGAGGNVVPPLMITTPYGAAAADNAYGDRNNNGDPEVAIGRLPVVSSSELDAVVAKIAAYEDAPRTANDGRLLLVADVTDSGGNFQSSCDAVAAAAPSTLPAEMLYLGQTTAAALRGELLSDLQSGVGFLYFSGHSNLYQLGLDGLLKTGDVAGLGNLERLPIVTADSCYANAFQNPGRDTIGEALMLDPNGGAVAVLSSSLMSMEFQARVLTLEFERALWASSTPTIGEAAKAALRTFVRKQGGAPYMALSYVLLGDPATRTRVPVQ
jgi:uncharacterized repeat protein (TIGR01451 family)